MLQRPKNILYILCFILLLSPLRASYGRSAQRIKKVQSVTYRGYLQHAPPLPILLSPTDVPFDRSQLIPYGVAPQPSPSESVPDTAMQAPNTPEPAGPHTLSSVQAPSAVPAQLSTEDLCEQSGHAPAAVNLDQALLYFKQEIHAKDGNSLHFVLPYGVSRSPTAPAPSRSQAVYTQQ